MKEGGRAEHGVSERGKDRGGKRRIEGGKGREGGWVVSRGEGGIKGGRE